MATLAIVKNLDVLEDFLFGFFSKPILSMVGQLNLQGAEEALRRGSSQPKGTTPLGCSQNRT
jgi:hypothetical protein